MPNITPVVLSGGAGTRLWPLSRQHHPKQLLPLTGERSLLQQTVQRFATEPGFAPPIVVTGEPLRFIVAEQLRAIGAVPQCLLLEPVARNTAPAVAAAALFALQADPQAILLVVPSDHAVGDVPRLLSAIRQAEPWARDDHLITFAIRPTRPETGYGYIRRGARVDTGDELFTVAGFVEKPDAERAAAFVKSGEYWWNSGMFMFSARQILTELECHAPEVMAAIRHAVAKRSVDHDFIRLDAECFADAPAVSIDKAVMERTSRALTLPCDMGWSDVGAWDQLWEISPKDDAGNAATGEVVIEECRNCLIHTSGPLVAAVGVENLVVVVTDDAVLVTSHQHAQDVRKITDRLRRDGRPELANHVRVYRPWGFYQSIHTGERFQVKRLTVNPGAQLSLQKHYHRAEHWVVVNGTALVTRDGESVIVRENESVYLPLGSVHRLENPGKLPLNLIEVQSGPYLGEDDIIRVEDRYGRR
ncbi:MAG TPA: mannose-1-phosphate guanylyltransferase/mannose-6-phosphate isomerase [Magnetospirillum sp.]|nr:mannose-1-phosphate guanylyltransferase/mannose-6-phosphate isomerase [Magnetospirillum sp.]